MYPRAERVRVAWVKRLLSDVVIDEAQTDRFSHCFTAHMDSVVVKFTRFITFNYVVHSPMYKRLIGEIVAEMNAAARI